MGEPLKATLDLTDCKYLGELHQRIKKALDFPDYYGENWSAFWDCLRFECYFSYIEIVGEQTMAEELKRDMPIMRRILQRCKEERARLGFSFDFVFIS